MYKLGILIIFVLAVNILTADLVNQAKEKIKSGDFVEADNYISTYLSRNPMDSRAYIYKCFSDIGIFFEDTLPNYLINNFNADNNRTLKSFDFDQSKQEIKPTEIKLTTTDGTNSLIGYWVYYPEIKFPLGDPKNAYRYASIFDMSIESESKSVFNLENGFYYPANDDSAISFTYYTDNPSQVNFEINSKTDYGVIKIYLNGSEIGEINNSYYTLYRNVRSDLYGSGIEGYGSIPLFLHYGDVLSFVSKPINAGSNSSNIGIRPLNPYNFHPPELGIAYNITYPNLGNNISIDIILDIFKKNELPVRELIRKLINNLNNFDIEDEVTVDSLFYSGKDSYNDVIIQYWDALVVKSILSIIELFLVVSDQYNIGINYDYEELSNIDIRNSAKTFFSAFPNLLEINPSRVAAQLSVSTDLESALTDFKNSLNAIWNRDEPGTYSKDYLIKRSEYSDSDELADINAFIDSLMQSINGFDEFSNLTGNSADSFEYTLKPIVGQTPFSFKEAIIDYEYLSDTYGKISTSRKFELLEHYGLARDLYWVPQGWVYYAWPYAYNFTEARWHFFNNSNSQWRVNLTNNIWSTLDKASGWNYYAWPYSYSFEKGAWYWYINDSQWVVNLDTEVWKIFGSSK